MMKRLLALGLAICLALSAAVCAAESAEIDWAAEERAKLSVGNPTALRGRFFSTLWGGTTSDMDVQDLLHAYSPVLYDMELTRFRFDESVIEDAVALGDKEGNRTYILYFYDDLFWSDGSRITAWDYAFSILFSMDPVIAETGGKPKDYSWIVGAEEYLDHTADTLAGLRVLSDQILQIKVKADALPYFYELHRLMIYPYPIRVIAPGLSVTDEGNGAALSGPLTAETLRQTVLDPEKGYLSHPQLVSGPYTLTSFDGTTATLQINPYYKGTEAGVVPHIGELVYTRAKNEDMIERLQAGEFDLLNKVTMSDTIMKGIMDEWNNERYWMDNYVRSGETLIWFMEGSALSQEKAVRQAIAYCFDRDRFVQDYTGHFGIRMDAFSGIGQWMYQLAIGQISAPVDTSLPKARIQEIVDKYAQLTLDGLTVYEPDTEKAAKLLDDAGWKAGADGIRRKTVDGEEKELRLTLGMPESEEAARWLQETLLDNLMSIGVPVSLVAMTMERLEEAYEDEGSQADMLYLGENFPVIFDPDIVKPHYPTEEAETAGELTAAKTEIWQMARDLVKTDPNDLYSFMRKWVAVQEKISESLILLPVYSNVYFDFFTRELHDYQITDALTWGAAIVRSYMSDIEFLKEEDRQAILEELENLDLKKELKKEQHGRNEIN